MLARNNPAPVFICRNETIDRIDSENIPLGASRDVRPLISEIAIEPGLVIIIYTDGLTHAGSRRGTPMDVADTIQSVLEEENPSPQLLADTLLAQALRLDENQPVDDISVVVIKVTAREGDNVRAVCINDDALDTVMEAGYEVR